MNGLSPLPFAMFVLLALSGLTALADETESGLRYVKPGVRSEDVVSLKPKKSLVPDHMLSDISDITSSPDNVLPGIVSELAKGVDITSGDPLNLVSKQIFVWTYDMDFKQNWNGKTFAIPDQVSIFLKNVCLISEIKTSSMSTSFTESTTSQASSWSAGFDQKVDIGVEYKGISMGTQIQNTMMFGNSKVSQEYESQFHQERTMSMTTSSRAEAYNSQLYDDKIEDSWFHPWFKDAARSFGQNPTKKLAFDMFDDYGTHFIQEAELGGEASRNVYFHETIDKTAAKKYFREASSSTIGWLWFGGSKSDSKETTTTSTDGKRASVYTSATTIVGGDPSADTPGEFCASLEHYQTPRVLTFKKLVPIWNVLDKIDGVPDGTGKKMLHHVNSFWHDGEECAETTCGGEPKMCTWRPKTRTWGVPCKCLSTAAMAIPRPDLGLTVEMVEFERGDGEKLKVSGHLMYKGRDPDAFGDGIHLDSYQLDINGPCFVWPNGKPGKEQYERGGGWYKKMTITVNHPPGISFVCFYAGMNNGDECSEEVTNFTGSSIQKTYTGINGDSNFWIQMGVSSVEDFTHFTQVCSSCDYTGAAQGVEERGVGVMSFWQCTDRCKAETGCTAIDFGKNGRAGECFLNFGGDGETYMANGSDFDAFVMLPEGKNVHAIYNAFRAHAPDVADLASSPGGGLKFASDVCQESLNRPRCNAIRGCRFNPETLKCERLPVSATCADITRPKTCRKRVGCSWMGANNQGLCVDSSAAPDCSKGKNSKKCRKISGCKWARQDRGKKCVNAN